jgi:uncharacterized protein (TIGR04255 family)
VRHQCERTDLVLSQRIADTKNAVNETPEEKIEFEAPPVVETVLSIQFAPISGFTAAHAGCFWNQVGSSSPEWRNAKLNEIPRLEDEFENLGSEQLFGVPSWHIRPAIAHPRIQIIHPDQERMVQVQDSRFVYNWRKGSGPYPSYAKTKPAFDDLFGLFKKYLDSAAFPAPQPNQWEIIYINQVPKGKLWTRVAEWADTLPGLYMPTGYPLATVECETMGCTWRYRLSEGRGRLHISLQHGRTQEPEKLEVILLQLTARGPIADGGLTAEAGFALGHSAIVNTFKGMTSKQAHTEWKETSLC